MFNSARRLNKCIFLILTIAFLFSEQGLAQVDLSGNWDNGAGIGFIQPQAIGNSICVVACAELETEPAPARVRVMPARPVYKAEFLAKVQDLNDRQVEEDPVLRCAPPGVPRIGPPDKIVQTPTEIIFLYDDVSGNFFRVIPIDGRGHRQDIELSFLGDAIGHWEDDTLVVETTNLNDETWLTDDGSFHTTNLRVEERVSRNGNELTWQATAFDQSILAEPWVLPIRTATFTEFEILEAPTCQDRDLEHVVDGTHHDNVR